MDRLRRRRSEFRLQAVRDRVNAELQTDETRGIPRASSAGEIEMDYRRTLRWATIRLLSALLAAALLASALYGAELCFWLADPQRKLPPCNQYIDGVRYSWGQPIHRNRLGFRSREIGPKPPGAFRIMVLGDSMTWGAGIARPRLLRGCRGTSS